MAQAVTFDDLVPKSAGNAGISFDDLIPQVSPTNPAMVNRSSNSSGFFSQMGANFTNALQSARDLATGNYEDIGHTLPTPKTQALADKLFPQGSQGSFMDAMRNVGNTSASDWSGALLEKFSDTPEGKALSVIGGLHPVYNAVGTTIGGYVNPAISKATGVSPETLQLGEMLVGTAGLKKAGQINDPLYTLAKKNPLIADESSGAAEPSPTFSDLRNASSASYQQMRNAGATLNQQGANMVVSSIVNALKKSGLMNDRLHGDTLSVVQDLKNSAASGNIDLEHLDQFRQLLGDVVTNNTTKLEGPNQDAFKANIAIHALDEAVDSINQQHLSAGTSQAIDALNQARDLYSASSRMRDVQRIIDNAYMTDNPATAIRKGFSALAKQVNTNARGWTPDEIAAINHAAKTGIITGALKVGGSRLISGMTGAMGGAMGGGVPGAIAGATAAEMMAFPLRAAANALQESRGNTILDLIANRPQVQSALQAPPISSLPSGPMGNPFITQLLQQQISPNLASQLRVRP